MTQTVPGFPELPMVFSGSAVLGKGSFDDGGSNLYVNAHGEIERIHRTDLDADGYPDIVVPNTHGHLERGPTRIFRADGQPGPTCPWSFTDLPNDSGWLSRVEDVDGDGWPDLVVVNGENGVTSELTSYVYWGGPGGLTGERTELPTVGAYDVAILDLTGHGDGRLDLAMASAWRDHHNPGRPLAIHLFVQVEPRRFVDLGAESGVTSVAGISIAAGSLRAGGPPDLAIANLYSEYDPQTESFVWLGRPGGGFEAEPIRLPTRGASVVRMADLDGDGLPEVIFAGGGEVRIYWNRGGLVSADDVTRLEVPGVENQFRHGAIGMTVADTDGDGRPELVLAMRDGIEIRRSDALDRPVLVVPLRFVTSVEAADLDGDGRPELLVAVYQDEATHDVPSRIYWNGPEGFRPDTWTPLPAAGVMGITAGDLDGDGRPEVVLNVTMQGPSSTWREFPTFIYQGGPGRAFDPVRRLEIPSGGEVYAYAIADLDLDGYPDLVLARIFGLRIFRGGPGGISSDDWYEILIPDVVCMQVHVADLNHDGWLDLIALVQTYDDLPETRANSTRIFWGGPDGYSMDRSTVLETYSTGSGILADIDNDGYLDLVVAEKTESLAIHHGGPGASWPSGRVSVVPVGTRGHPSSVTVADLDRDGYLDLVIGVAGHYARSPESFVVLWGGPDGYSAERALRYDGSYSPGQVTVADLDGDGHLKIVVPAYSAAASRRLPWEIHSLDGRALAGPPQRFPGLGSCHVLPVDFDGDGRIDLLVSNHRDDDVHTAAMELYWNGPDGISAENVTRLPAMGPHYLTIRDPRNTRDRSDTERYVLPPVALTGERLVRLGWEADIPAGTSLSFEIRWAGTDSDPGSATRWAELEAEIGGVSWTGVPPGDPPAGGLDGVFPGATGCGPIEGGRHLWGVFQVRVGFSSPTGASSPRLRAIGVNVVPASARDA